MPTLAAPQTATYTTTSPNESVNVICTGATDCMLVSWVGPAGTSGQRMVRNTTAAGEDIGPLLDNTSVTFAAMAGAPSYTAPAFASPVQALVSGYGNLNQDKLSQLFGDDEMIIGTFANRPLATTVAPGKEFAASDLGYARWVSDGTRWILLKPGNLLNMATPSSITDSEGQATTESTLLSLTIPAGALGPNDGLQLDLIWSCTNSAAAKRIRSRFGGTVLFNLDLTTHLVFRQSVKLRNRNSQSSQISQGNSTTNFGPIGSVGTQAFTVDFATAQALTITGQFPVTGTGTNTLTLEEATIAAI